MINPLTDKSLCHPTKVPSPNTSHCTRTFFEYTLIYLQGTPLTPHCFFTRYTFIGLLKVIRYRAQVFTMLFVVLKHVRNWTSSLTSVLETEYWLVFWTSSSSHNLASITISINLWCVRVVLYCYSYHNFRWHHQIESPNLRLLLFYMSRQGSPIEYNS